MANVRSSIGMVHNSLVQVEEFNKREQNEEAKRTLKEAEGKKNHGEKDVTNIFCAVWRSKSPHTKKREQT